jgi:hypothetical protein
MKERDRPDDEKRRDDHPRHRHKREDERKRKHHRNEDRDEDSRRKKKRSRRDEDKKRRHHDERQKKKKRREHDRSDDESSRERSRKRDKDKKHKKEKKKRKESRRDREKSSVKKLHVDKSKLLPLGDPLGHPPEVPIDPEKDYFAFHQHLWLYLFRERQTAFNDLTSEEAHQAFTEFCELYNRGTLETAYYEDELPAEALEECKTTGHKWGFRISDVEDRTLHKLQQGVRKQTQYRANTGSTETPASSQAAAASRSTEVVGMMRRGLSAEERLAQRRSDKRLKEHVKAAEEEWSGGRKEGRERQIEKRKEVAAKIHGAARDREGAAASIELSDADLYGSGGTGDTDLQKALAVEQRRKAARQEKNSARLEELQAKEREKQQAMIKMLGLSDKLKSGKKIQIAPRRDT